MSKVKCIVLTTGLELMGDVEEKHEYVVLKEAAHVALVPQNGKMGYAIIPWLPYAETNSFSINVNNILTTFEPSVDMLNYYSQVMGTGIQIATASSIN